MRVKILRQRGPFGKPYWQAFRYEGSLDGTVASLLDDLNFRDDIEDEDGNPVPRISWECSCLQGSCGSCAMVINGRPALACEVFLRDVKGGELTIRPLRKFPVISDLVVDRAGIQANLQKAGVFIEEYAQTDKKEYGHQYSVAKCLKCGLCLEVCPNYVKGERFYGAAFANDCYLVTTRSKEQQTRIRQEYAEHFARGCSGALSCMDVCPAKLPTLASIAKMNR